MNFKYIYPKFENGSILNRSLLEQLREFPNNFINLQFDKYGDGILTGLDIVKSSKENELTLKRGIIKLKDKFWFLTEDYSFPSEQKNSGYLLFSLENGGISIKPDINSNKEFQLGEINANGGTISGEIDKLDFYKTQIDNYIDRSNIPYSVYGGQIPMLKILHLFANKMLSNTKKNAIDFNFAMLCLGNTISYYQIKEYLRFKGMELENGDDVKAIYNKLINISSKISADNLSNDEIQKANITDYDDDDDDKIEM